MKTLSFNFESPSEKDRAVKELVRLFGRSGLEVVTTAVDKSASKKAGESYRNVNLTFADSQRVTMAFKSTGDVFEVRINGKAVPLQNQDDHAESVKEIAAMLDARRAAFQRAMAKAKEPLPPSVRVSRTSMMTAKVAKRDSLKESIARAQDELDSLTEEVGLLAE